MTSQPKGLRRVDYAAADHAGAETMPNFSGVKGVTGPVVRAGFQPRSAFITFFVGEEIALSAQHRPERIFRHGFGDHVGGAEEHDAAFMTGWRQSGLDRAGGMADDLQVVGNGHMLLGDQWGSPGGDDDGGAGEHFKQFVACVVAIQFIPNHSSQALQYGGSLWGEDIFGQANRG